MGRAWLSAAVAAALVVGACAVTEGPYQLPLFGDRECSGPCIDAIAAPCWVEHDVAYGVGGTEQDRFTADAEFLACMALHGVPEWWATARYKAVRKFGDDRWPLRDHRTRGPPTQ